MRRDPKPGLPMALIRSVDVAGSGAVERDDPSGVHADEWASDVDREDVQARGCDLSAEARRPVSDYFPAEG